ncbi:MAG TPA: class I SAM-dependent methyltransferase [Acidimicrobiales bacterium]|nr:class I SAM-dependent methyltransferase [Acidimicrobiales bacterium]
MGRDYAFGDSDLAARRLELVAAVFGEPTRALLHRAARLHGPVGLAVDLGCGPGLSTALLHETVGATRTVGLDASPAFVARASARAPAEVSYMVHDVRSVPFPVGPADVVLARLLLAHLPDPVGTARTWVTQLKEGGLLVLDEIEFIHTGHPVLARYEELAVAVVAARGGPMYAGPELAAPGALGGRGWMVRACELVRLPVATAQAAAMFSLNLPTWRDDGAITSRWTTDEVDSLARQLDELRHSPATGEITWGLRQVVVERTG